MFRISSRNFYFGHTLRDSFTVSNANRHPNSHNINLVKLCLHTSHDRECRWNKKVQGAFPYYLIVVHEEADDECAHAQLIVDTILLRYRGTSLTMSSRTTRALPKTVSWVAAWIDFCFRSNPSFFLTSEMKTENSLLGKIEVAGRYALVASSQAS
jgi:hypothetical protein